MKEQNHALLSAIVVALGAMIVMIALDVIPYDPEKIHAPDWVLILAGGVFVFGGLALHFRTNELLVSVLGNLIVVSFAAVAAWVALDGSSDQFSGGIPFLPHAANVKIARIVFAGSAVMCALILLPGLNQLYEMLKRRKNEASSSSSTPEHE